MSKYEIIFEALQEKYELGEITYKFANYVNDLAYEKYVMEKKTREEYNKERFKKKYKVDINTNIKTRRDPDGNVSKKQINISVNKEEPKITLTSSFFKLKNDGRRDAILKHEIGHEEMHSKNDSKRDKRFSDNICIHDRLKRHSALDEVKKYEGSNKSHANMLEFEADRYAANRSSLKNLKHGIEEVYKQELKDKYIKSDLKALKKATHGNKECYPTKENIRKERKRLSKDMNNE